MEQEMELPGIHQPGEAHSHEHGHGHDHHAPADPKSKRLNHLVAITVVLVSTFLGVTHLKDENTILAMHHAEAQVNDSWNYYQAKREREYIAGTASALVTAVASAGAEGQAKRFDKDVKHYHDQAAEIQKTAEKQQETYEHLNATHETFDIADAALSLSLALLAVTALTGQVWLLGVSWLLSGAGAVIGAAGLAGVSLHLEGLTKLFS